MKMNNYKTIATVATVILLSVVIFYFAYKAKTPTPINQRQTQYFDLGSIHDPKGPNYGCEIHKECGDLVGVDCDSSSDGPYYYVNKNNNSIVSYCGGYCMGAQGQCENCPPKEWSCKD